MKLKAKVRVKEFDIEEVRTVQYCSHTRVKKGLISVPFHFFQISPIHQTEDRQLLSDPRVLVPFLLECSVPRSYREGTIMFLPSCSVAPPRFDQSENSLGKERAAPSLSRSHAQLLPSPITHHPSLTRPHSRTARIEEIHFDRSSYHGTVKFDFLANHQSESSKSIM